MVAAGRGILLSKTPKLIAAFTRTAYTLKMVWHIRHDHPSIGSAQGLELRLKIVVRDGSVYSPLIAGVEKVLRSGESSTTGSGGGRWPIPTKNEQFPAFDHKPVHDWRR